MRPLRIYADFNGLVPGPVNPAATAVVLDTYGSVRDLANAGVALSVGLPLIGVDWSDEMEDLEGHGTAQYDAFRKWWVIEFDAHGVRYVPAGDRTPLTIHRCLGCRVDMGCVRGSGGMMGSDGRSVPCCSTWGTPIDAPIAAPHLASM
jgi:hypothetical protein